MKQINHAINGLASSLLLNVGFTSIAEKFDALSRSNEKSEATVLGAAPCVSCEWPCNFTPETGE